MRALRSIDGQIRVMREQGHTQRQIAQVLRVSISHVSRTLRFRLGMARPQKPRPVRAQRVRSAEGRGAEAGIRARSERDAIRALVRAAVPPLTPVGALPDFSACLTAGVRRL